MTGSVSRARTVFTVAAGILWAAGIAGVWILPERAGDLVAVGAAACTVCSFAGWLAQAPRDRRLLVRELVDAYLNERHDEPKRRALRSVRS
jgi:hypothetical protein